MGGGEKKRGNSKCVPPPPYSSSFSSSSSVGIPQQPGTDSLGVQVNQGPLCVADQLARAQDRRGKSRSCRGDRWDQKVHLASCPGVISAARLLSCLPGHKLGAAQAKTKQNKKTATPYCVCTGWRGDYWFCCDEAPAAEPVSITFSTCSGIHSDRVRWSPWVPSISNVQGWQQWQRLMLDWPSFPIKKWPLMLSRKKRKKPLSNFEKVSPLIHCSNIKVH